MTSAPNDSFLSLDQDTPDLLFDHQRFYQLS